MKLKSVLSACLILLVAAGAGVAQIAVPADSTVIILRHADRTDENLNARGIARAVALVGALEGFKIDMIISPGIQRNLDTAAPLALARGLEITRMPAQKPAKRLMQAATGKTVVWIGNKGNLRQIWKAIGAPEPGPQQYGDLFIVTRGADGTPQVDRRRFGVD